MFTIFLLHVLFFSCFALAIATIPSPYRAVYFYSYLSVVLILGGFLGNAYSLPISDGVFVSGGNLAYGAFMMASIIFVLLDRDIFILRRIIQLVVVVDVFNILLSYIIIYTYSLPETVNPHAVSSALFEVSVPLIFLGGVLIIIELVFILFCFEIFKKFSVPPKFNRISYFFVFVSVLTFDGVAFPLIAFGPSQEVIAITIGGLQGKFLTAVSYGVSFICFTFFFTTRFSVYLEDRVFSWQAIVYTSSQIIDKIERKDEQLKDASRLQSLAGSIAKLGSWRVALDQAVIVWSPEAATIHDEPVGMSPTLERGMEYYVPEHRDRIRTQFEACANEGRPFDEILQIETRKGRMVWVRAIGEPVRDDGGSIVAVEGALQDISEIIAVRDEAAELSAQLRRTLDGMTDAFFLLDHDWQFSFINARAETLLQRSTGDLLGKNIWDEFPDAVDSKFQQEYQRAVAERQLVRFEDYFSPLKIWVEVNADPTSAGLAVYFRDITQQRARDEQLRLLEAAVGRQNDVLLITEAEPIDSPNGPKIVYVNEAFERHTGFTREEVMGQTPRILQGPKTQRDELDRIRSALTKWEPVRAELINYTKSGQEFWLELDIVPLANEKGWFTHWVSIERDITTRKQTEQLLKSNEERFRLVTKAAGSAIWDWDATTNRQWWSEGLREIFGHDVDLTGVLPTLWHMHIHPDDATRVNAAFARVESGQDDFLRETYRFRRADGSWTHVEDKAFAVKDAEGKIVRILGSMTDISEQHLLEERLRQAQKMETVGQLTGGVAHDFNNLLMVILGNAEILEDALAGQPHLQRLAKLSLFAAERGAELTNRLLAFSRKQALQPKVLDIAQLIQGMEGLLRRSLPENISIEVIRGGGLWKIEIDPAQLESALLNLAVNARDAMPKGGCLTIEMANALLDSDYVATEPNVDQGQYLLIIVTDTGQGISAENLDKVFDPFFTTKEVGKGSGLGLSMVFGFVKQSGGHIRIYSELGEGTSVKLYFPRSRVEKEHVATDRTGRKIIGGTETVLLVEDDGAVREHVVAQLQSLGYNVIGASSGLEAMEVLRKSGNIDLLFTDVVMPGGMGGRELAEAARRFRPSLKILYTSGYTENSIVHNGRLDRGVKLLSKPYRRDQLATKVREVLDEIVQTT